MRGNCGCHERPTSGFFSAIPKSKEKMHIEIPKPNPLKI
jgi:hypothetical protein